MINSLINFRMTKKEDGLQVVTKEEVIIGYEIGERRNKRE